MSVWARVKGLFFKSMKQEEEKMDKKKENSSVQWSPGYSLIGDGLPPTLTPFGAVLRCPLPINPAPGGQVGNREVSLGVKFDVPVYITPNFHAGVKEVLYGPLLQAGEPVRIVVDDRAQIDAKQTVVNVFFFCPPDVLVER